MNSKQDSSQSSLAFSLLSPQDDPRARDTTARVRALLATLTRPAEWRRRGLAATGTLLFLGFGQ